MALIKGTDLTPRQRSLVLAAFVHRHLGPYTSDAEWLAHYAFHFVKDGSRLAGNRRYAEPLGSARCYPHQQTDASKGR